MAASPFSTKCTCTPPCANTLAATTSPEWSRGWITATPWPGSITCSALCILYLSDYRERYYDGELEAFQRTYFEHLAMAAETGLFDTVAHPDLIKNTEPAEWHVDRAIDFIRPCLDRIAATGMAMELNTSGLNKVTPEMSPGMSILEEMRQRNIPVVIGADAHDPDRVAANFEDALDALNSVGYTEVSLFLNRERVDISIDLARDSLRS